MSQIEETRYVKIIGRPGYIRATTINYGGGAIQTKVEKLEDLPKGIDQGSVITVPFADKILDQHVRDAVAVMLLKDRWKNLILPII